MKISLGDVAAVQTGYSFRSRIESMTSGAIAVIQMKDLTDANRVDCSELLRVDMEVPKEHHFVRPGDLIFRSRGLTTKSALLLEDPGCAVLAAPLLRVRVESEDVLPDYLNWYFSQMPAQSYFTSCLEGKMISKQSLENVPVPVPSLERQRLIVQAAMLAEKEQRILRELAMKRNQYIASTLLHLAQGE